MATELSEHIANISIFNTHEHMRKEPDFRGLKPDVLCEVFDNYVVSDLRAAGASEDAMTALLDRENLDVAERFNSVSEAWSHCGFTGYGEVSRYVAQRYFDIEDINAETIAAAQGKLPEQWEEGLLYRTLKEEANYDHIQTDDFVRPCLPDPAGPDFFLYDISWMQFSNGGFDVEALRDETGIEVTDLKSLRSAMETVFELYAPCAIAVKSQHAYNRTLKWEPRDDADAEAVVQKILCGAELAVDEKLCLGDWSLERGVELAGKHNLPFKIHTGYYAGNNYMDTSFIRASLLHKLLQAHRETRFVLMHISYPFQEEVISVAKHFTNVWVDMCWAWSINPHSSAQFLRSFIHAVPINKLFGFGGDTFSPFSSVGYGRQARTWLTRALQQEVDADVLTESEAIHIATRILQENQMDCFDLDGTRAAIQAAMSA